ncbi:MAG: insulinase family protein [Candidatus Rokubacteria bacterium]|nr:insulinase family protein [Candidatus Rokubacteria bacterium]
MVLRRRIALAVLVLLTASACAAGRSPAPSAGPGATPRRHVLANGVRIVVEEHRLSDVAAVQLWVAAGGRDEGATELGLAHYLEHMLFKGTPSRPPGSIDRLIEGLGGQSNAYTSYDYTHYDLVLPARHLDTGLELLADIAVHAAFDPTELEAERRVVFEEMRLTEDNPDRFLLRRLYELAYRPHPYGRPLLGTPELIAALTRERLAAYYRRYYQPDAMVLVVVGAVDPGQVRRRTAATFGRLTGRADPRPLLPPVPSLACGRRADVERPERQAYLGLAWQTSPTNQPDVYAVDLLTYILGDSPSSRLNQRLRERERLVFNIEAGYGAWDKAGLVTVTARLDPANLERAEASVLDVLRQVKAEGIGEAERQRALITAESHYAFDIETAEGLAKTYGQAEVTWTLAEELAYLERLRRVTAGEIQAVARRYFGEDDYACVRFRPRAGR